MPRSPGIWYRKSVRAFYSTIDGEQYPLAQGPDDRPSGPCYRMAQDEFNRLMDDRRLGRTREDLTTGNLILRYLNHIRDRQAQNTVAVKRTFLNSFAAEYGSRKYRDLLPADVYAWCDRHRKQPGAGRGGRGWGQSSICGAVKILSAWSHWVRKSFALPVNPLASMERPRPRARGDEALITPEDHRTILSVAPRAFRVLITALEHTGARPGELIAASAADWNDNLGALVYLPDDTRPPGRFRHKTAGRGETRRIFFRGSQLDVIRGLIVNYPTGPLFRNSEGNAWTIYSVGWQAKDCRAKVGLPHYSCHGYRHTFITRAILAGMSVEKLADLVGNSPPTIYKHYKHLLPDDLRDALDVFLAKKEQSGKEDNPLSIRLFDAS